MKFRILILLSALFAISSVGALELSSISGSCSGSIMTDPCYPPGKDSIWADTIGYLIQFSSNCGSRYNIRLLENTVDSIIFEDTCSKSQTCFATCYCCHMYYLKFTNILEDTISITFIKKDTLHAGGYRIDDIISDTIFYGPSKSISKLNVADRISSKSNSACVDIKGRTMKEDIKMSEGIIIKGGKIKMR